MADPHFGIQLVVPPTLARCSELARLIESLKFDSIHGHDGAGSWDPFVLTYEMIRSTKSIPIRLSIINPYDMHPVKIALAAATLQHSAGGRFGLTYAGGSLDTLHSMGLDWVHPALTIRESILVLRQLLTGEKVDFDGKMVTAKGNQIWFKPPPEIPLYIGCQRKWLLRLAGEITNGVIIDSATHHFAGWGISSK